MKLNYYKNDKLKDKILYIFIIFIIISVINYFVFQVLSAHKINLIAFSLMYSIIITTIIWIYLFNISLHKQGIKTSYQTLDQKNDELENYNKMTSKKINELNQTTEKYQDIINQKTIQIKTLTDKLTILSEIQKNLELELNIYKQKNEALVKKYKNKIDIDIANANNDNTDNNNELLIKKEG